MTLFFSPCPNDTFALEALANARFVSTQPWKISLHDIETLNQQALQNISGIYKVSAATYHQLPHYTLLPCGMALTKDGGPILVATRKTLEKKLPSTWKLAIPGLGTTAAFLAEKLGPHVNERISLRYDLIPEAILQGHVDAGVLIHESRFLYSQMGLALVCDLGLAWQKQVQAPLILSCVVATPDIDRKTCENFVHDFRTSLDLAWKNPNQALPYIKQHAKEKNDLIIKAHIEHFVSDITHTPTAVTLQTFHQFFSHDSPTLNICNAC